MPHVTVIIPAFNCERYIAAAVKSVLDQTHRDFDLIVVDDGSTDGTAEGLRVFGDRIQLLRQANAGAAAARNRGLRVARGELIGFLDADDWWEPDRLAAQLAAFHAFPAARLAFSDFFVADADGFRLRDRGIRWKYGVVRDEMSAPWLRVFAEARRVFWFDRGGQEQQANAYCGRVERWLFRGNMINTCSVLLRRDLFHDLGGFDEALQTEEDYDFWLRVARHCPFIYVDAPLLTFRRRPGQLTQTDGMEKVVRNVVTVVERAARQLVDQLDAGEIAARLARVHLDLGVLCMRKGCGAEARQHFAVSWRHQGGSLVLIMFVVLSWFPRRILLALEGVWSSIRRYRHA